MPEIVKIIEWILPYFGNRHIIPYGKLLVSDGVDKKICKTKGDTEFERGPQYITFKRKRYRVVNEGTRHNPNLILKDYE